jgi:hypothetical protein
MALPTVLDLPLARPADAAVYALHFRTQEPDPQANLLEPE